MRFNADEDAPIVAKNYAPRNAQPIPAGQIDSEPSLNIKVNQAWFSHLIGVLAALDQPDAWQGTSTAIEDARAEIRKLIANAETETVSMSLPIGLVIPSAALVAAVPDWLLLCDGATHNRVDYPDLYDVLESAFVLDADTFNVPDLNERIPLGATSSIGSIGGEEEHTLTIAEMPAHNHDLYPTTSPILITATLQGLPVDQIGRINGDATGIYLTRAHQTGSRGGGAVHNNMQPYQRLRYFIVAAIP